jgi:hypothetical protein
MKTPLPRLTVTVLLAACLSACALFQPPHPGVSEQDLQAEYGAPAEVFKNTDGSVTWEYPLGPTGHKTYMVDIGPDRQVRRVSQVLSDEQFAKVQPGMSLDQVHRMLGRPKEINRYPGPGEEVWSWRYRQANLWYQFFNVHFDPADGKVMRVSRIEDPVFTDKGGDHR